MCPCLRSCLARLCASPAAVVECTIERKFAIECACAPSEHFDLLGASPSFGDAAPRTLSELQAADAALRPAAPGRAEVRLYGGGILVDLEVAIPGQPPPPSY